MTIHASARHWVSHTVLYLFIIGLTACSSFRMQDMVQYSYIPQGTGSDLRLVLEDY